MCWVLVHFVHHGAGGLAKVHYMKLYKMCWCCTLVHYGGGVGLVHLCTRCAGGFAQVVFIEVIQLTRLKDNPIYHIFQVL